jgi:hypothetical protein
MNETKVYIITEGHYENIIRCVTFCPKVANRICESFPHLSLYVQEKYIVDDECLNKFFDNKNKVKDDK